jgi:hypothetical protein
VLVLQGFRRSVLSQHLVDDYVLKRLKAEIDLERLKEKINPPSK